MTLALGLLLAALLIGLLGPTYLRRAMSARLRPGVMLTGWVGSVLVALGCAAASAALLSLPFHASADTVLGMAAVCVNTGQHLWETIVRLGGAVALFGAAIRVAFVALRSRKRGAAHRHRHLAALRVLGKAETRAGVALFWLPEDMPVAYSFGGRRAAIIATTGVSRLAPTTRAAILAHERAHLGGRHHGLVRMVEVLAKALPFVPLLRSAPAAVRVLVELCADDAAARSCGSNGVRAALRATQAGAVPAGSLAMSSEAVELRMRWLAPADDRARQGLRHRAGYVAAAAATFTPVVAGIALAAGAILLLCLGASSPL